MAHPPSSPLPDSALPDFLAFDRYIQISGGPLDAVVQALWEHAWDHPGARPQLFHGPSGQPLDLACDGPLDTVLARARQHYAHLATAASREGGTAARTPAPAAGRGRPRLGVVAREVTLLPRHWEWLSAQPGGASVVLRRLVEQARLAGGATQQAREAREAAYRFMSALAGDQPGFEEASRALFAGNASGFAACTADWPGDVVGHLMRLASPGLDAPSQNA